MIVTDLDGTYLRTDKSVSEYSLSIVEQCRKKGIIFVIATARPIRAVEIFLPDIKYDSAIFHNGAVVKANEVQLDGFGISEPGKLVLQILRDVPELKAAVEMDDTMYANFDPSGIWKGITYIPTDFETLPEGKADKILIEVSTIDEMKKYERYLPEDLYIQLSENTVAIRMACDVIKLKPRKVK